MDRPTAARETADGSVKIGLLGIGLKGYWSQFEGLRERLDDYLTQVADRIRTSVEVVDAGIVDDVDKAFAAGDRFRRDGAEIIFLYITTYALSSTVLPIVQRSKLPVVVLNLQPDLSIDFEEFNRRSDRVAMTGDWLAWCSACPAPEIANVFKRAGLPYREVVGTLAPDDPCWLEIDAWVEAAQVAHQLAYNRCGLLGHYYNGMLDIYTDVTLLQATFGGHFEQLEIDELAELRREVPPDAVASRVEEFKEHFDLQADISSIELDRAARTSVALDRLVSRYQLGSMVYYYEGRAGTEHQDLIGSVILGSSMLIANGIPVAGEYEVKNALAMKILSNFGAGGSFTEYYAVDYSRDVVLMGHDGPGHIGIARGRTKVRPLSVYHGKPSSGLSVEMSVESGPVTLLSVIEHAGSFQLLYAEGSAEPGPILEIGNTNSRYRFPCGARSFIRNWNEAGPAHHCAIGIGHLGSKLEKLGALLGISTHRVC